MRKQYSNTDFLQLARDIKAWGKELGFQHIGITDTELSTAEQHLLDWLRRGFHGEMAYMQRHGSKRSRPSELEAGTVCVISARMDYLPPAAADPQFVLQQAGLGYISRYALGRDYHKVVRHRLQQLSERITQRVGPFGYRVFSDSAPVLEKALAEKAGLGWIGKHSNLLQQQTGSWFFLGEIYTDMPLPVDNAISANHCGRCEACLEACPTNAIVAPYQVDARRCISYLTIELKSAIPIEFRPLMGNRIYGCDDCQVVCPWNRFAKTTREEDFRVRHGLDAPDLIELFAWDEAKFLRNTEGMAIRRIGHECWLRNIAVALGNALSTSEIQHDTNKTASIVSALRSRASHPSAMVLEHVQWALSQATL
ncbi:MAG: tRNA epoxyqueuosine(34) reductase QueG [Gammaproteobacteria bacterium]|nr:tRNA epoxyqueuosine(34) reductase QueG [Gammaproteobacteria bacterium]